MLKYLTLPMLLVFVSNAQASDLAAKYAAEKYKQHLVGSWIETSRVCASSGKNLRMENEKSAVEFNGGCPRNR
jgi:hypothetical protein